MALRRGGHLPRWSLFKIRSRITVYRQFSHTLAHFVLKSHGKIFFNRQIFKDGKELNISDEKWLKNWILSSQLLSRERDELNIHAISLSVGYKNGNWYFSSGNEKKREGVENRLKSTRCCPTRPVLNKLLALENLVLWKILFYAALLNKTHDLSTVQDLCSLLIQLLGLFAPFRP